MGIGDVRGIRARMQIDRATRPIKTGSVTLPALSCLRPPGGWLRGHVAWHGAAPKESERMTKILSAALKRDKRI